MKYNALIPELIVSDFKNSLDFYHKKIGFSIEYRRKDPYFAFLSLEGSQIMIQEIASQNTWEIKRPQYPFGCGINFQIMVKSVDIIATRSKKTGINIIEDISNNMYKTTRGVEKQKELVVSDPDGYVLRFSEKVR